MKSFVLVTVLLQLCLSVQNQPHFGDLIEFPKIKIGTRWYSHYGIFVGDENVPLNGRDGHNIFEMIRKPPGCRFYTYQGPFTVRNEYYNDLVPRTPEQMVATIEELMRPQDKRCKNYSLPEENCEQIATLVRYNRAMCRQRGTAAAGVARLANSRVKREKNKQKRRESSAAA